MLNNYKYEHIIPSEYFEFKFFPFRGSDGKNYMVRRHWHQWIEIFLVLEGSLEFYINSKMNLLKAKDYIIVNSNVIHSICAKHPNKTIVLQIPLECFDPYLKSNERIVFYKKDGEQKEKIINLMEEMYRIFSGKEYVYTLKVKGMFYALLYLMMTEFAVEEQDVSVLRQRYQLGRMSEIISYIEQHYMENITLDSLAKRFSFSPSYLSRMFQKYAKMNYKTYLLDLRSEEGCRELINTDFAIGTIAVNNGFPNSKAFAKAFKKRYGSLPSKYRKDMKV